MERQFLLQFHLGDNKLDTRGYDWRPLQLHKEDMEYIVNYNLNGCLATKLFQLLLIPFQRLRCKCDFRLCSNDGYTNTTDNAFDCGILMVLQL